MRLMKNSGIEWIGDIPSEWKVNSLFQIFSQVKNKNAGLKEKNLLSLSYGKIKRKSIDTIGGLLPENFDGYNIIETNDIVLRLTDLQNDHTSLRVGLSTERGIVTSAYLTLRNKSANDSKYLYYYLHSFDIAKGFYGMGAGVRQGLNWDGVKWLKFTIPTIQEQKKIADFLDEKCAEIDTVIEKTKVTIEEYKNLKQSVITQAVTKGIRPNRPMKDSGIEWIGEIPEDWNIRAIKTSFNVYAGATPKSEVSEFWDGDIHWITPADYKTEDKFVETGRRQITELGYNSCGTNLVPAKSIVFSKRAPIGSVAITKSELCTNQGCLSCFPKIELSVNYFYFVLSIFTEIFNLYGSGTTFKEISYDSFVNFRLPYPTASEQIEIADYLDKKCSEIDELIAKKTALLSELESYKKSLIYEYVTGKKEV